MSPGRAVVRACSDSELTDSSRCAFSSEFAFRKASSKSGRASARPPQRYHYGDRHDNDSFHGCGKVDLSDIQTISHLHPSLREPSEQAQDQLEQLFDPADPGFSSATGRIKSELLGLQRGPLQGLVIQE